LCLYIIDGNHEIATSVTSLLPRNDAEGGFTFIASDSESLVKTLCS